MRIRLSVWALAFASLAGGLQAQSASAKDVEAAIMLPKAAADVRREGVPAKDVSGALDILYKKNVPPADARNVLLTERDVAHNNGPSGNFGAFVQSKLDQGLRGRELADAIRAEHGLPPKANDKKVEKSKDNNKKVEKAKAGDKKVEKAKGNNKKTATKSKTKTKSKSKPAEQGKPTNEKPIDPMGH